MNAVGYFAEGARRGNTRRTIAEQNRAFLDFCTRQGYEVAATFLDTAGEPEGDAGFRQMLHFLGRGDRGFTVVAVDCLGALGPDLGRAALRLLAIEATGVQVVSLESGREAARELIESWAERGDATPVSERVRLAMRRKAVRGEVLGRPPYGYHVGARHRLEIVPEEAAIVRYIFRLYLLEGLGIRKIAGRLNEEGVPTRRGGRWSMVTIRDLLRNRAYLGTYTRFGVHVPGSHTPLISPEEFRLVQDRLQAHQGTTRERTVVPFLLSGLVHCARCGNRMIGVSRRQKWTTRDGEARSSAYRYYQCETRTNQSACGYNTQRAAELEAKTLTLIAEDNPAISRLRRTGNADSYIVDQGAQAERLEARMRRNRRQVEELVGDTAHGHISLDRLRSLGAGLVEEQRQLESELAGVRTRLAAHQTEAERHRHLEALRKALLRDWESLEFAARHSALREVVDRIEVDGPEARLFLRF